MPFIYWLRGDMWDEMWNSVGIGDILTCQELNDSVGTYFMGGEL